ncbi:hypothetical protein ABFA25_00880 [Mycobacterium lepromatosis]|uniref:hypothetical protein n=1 Tax=Mycobacterium lepromatosis TaxID=480418 RepID=UPI000B1E5B1E|nr:hypothetical protein [Mycobacterium lepromatosis]
MPNLHGAPLLGIALSLLTLGLIKGKDLRYWNVGSTRTDDRGFGGSNASNGRIVMRSRYPTRHH